MSFPSPLLSPPPLIDWQWSYNGLTFGSQSQWAVQNSDPYMFPAPAAGDQQRPREQGEFKGFDVMPGRDINLSLFTQGVSSADTSARLQALAAAFTETGATELPLYMKRPGFPILASMCRLRRRGFVGDVIYGYGNVAKPVLQMHATDPRWYICPTMMPSVAAPVQTGGMTWPITWPLSWNPSIVVAGLLVANLGNFDSRPILVFTGPLTIPRVTNLTTGWTIGIASGQEAPYTLAPGDTLTIDLDNHHVALMLNGQTTAVSRRNWVQPGVVWPNSFAGIAGLAPGVNQIQMTSNDSTSAGSVTVQCAGAYIL